jgi:hypothetical protein
LGIIFQWGTTGASGSFSSGDVTFPTPFPNACDNVEVTPKTSGTSTAAVGVKTVTATSFHVFLGTGQDDIYWFAVGH